MLREIIEEVRVGLKDRLRDIRHVARPDRRHNALATTRHYTSLPPFLPAEISGLLRHGVSAFDDAISAARSLAPRVPSRNARIVKGFAAYFPVDQRHALEAERAFRRDMYDAVRTAFRRRNGSDMLVHETDLVAVHFNLRRGQRKALSELENTQSQMDKVALAASLSASLLVELLALRPTSARPVSCSQASSSDVDRNHAIACFAPVALACGLATLDTENRSELDLMHVAGLVSDARIERLIQAYNSVDPKLS